MQSIRFDDGAAYERLMGVWSQLVGEVFLEWLSPAAGQRWLDIGCGNGAFTELLMRRCAPIEVQGIDPSEGQLAFARARAGTAGAVFTQGDARALPFDAGRFDAAVMALAIHFVPDPAKAVHEMARAVRPGGLVATYVWDALGGGSPTDLIITEMRAMGLSPAGAPSVQASTVEALHGLWTDAGLKRVASRTITVRRSFDDADDYWNAISGTGVPKAMLDRMDAGAIAELKDRVRARVVTDGQRGITLEARANAIMGYVPG